MLQFVQANAVLILSILLGLSETLALIPAIKSNSVFQLVYEFIKKLAPPKVP